MRIAKLQAELETEKEHSAFLERLLKALYGEDWEKLTLCDAEKWRKRHLSSKSSGQTLTRKEGGKYESSQP